MFDKKDSLWGFLIGLPREATGEGVYISCLLFVDDLLVFPDTFKEQMNYLSWLLMWFEVIGGLTINLDRSELFPMVVVNHIEYLTYEFGCKVGWLFPSILDYYLVPHLSL